MPRGCAVLRGFAIGARVALPWHHNANPSYRLASIPQYDDSANARRCLRVLLAGDWRVTGGVLKIACRIWEVGVAGWLVTGRRRGGAFSTLLLRPGLWASTGGILTT